MVYHFRNKLVEKKNLTNSKPLFQITPHSVLGTYRRLHGSWDIDVWLSIKEKMSKQFRKQPKSSYVQKTSNCNSRTLHCLISCHDRNLQAKVMQGLCIPNLQLYVLPKCLWHRTNSSSKLLKKSSFRVPKQIWIGKITVTGSKRQITNWKNGLLFLRH